MGSSSFETVDSAAEYLLGLVDQLETQFRVNTNEADSLRAVISDGQWGLSAGLDMMTWDTAIAALPFTDDSASVAAYLAWVRDNLPPLPTEVREDLYRILDTGIKSETTQANAAEDAVKDTLQEVKEIATSYTVEGSIAGVAIGTAIGSIAVGIGAVPGAIMGGAVGFLVGKGWDTIKEAMK